MQVKTLKVGGRERPSTLYTKKLRTTSSILTPERGAKKDPPKLHCRHAENAFLAHRSLAKEFVVKWLALPALLSVCL